MPEEKENAAAVEVNAPGGFRAKLSGIRGDQLLHLVIIALLAALLFKVFSIDKERAQQFDAVMASLGVVIAESHKIIANQSTILKALADSTDEQESTTYVLTLSDNERKALKLSMPSALRKKVRAQ